MLDLSRFTPIVLLTAHGPAEALLDEIGIQHEVWGPFTEPGHPFRYLLALLRALRWLKQQKVNLVHLNRANDWRPAELLAMRFLGIPVVTHFHTVNIDCAPATRWSTVIAAVSAHVAQHSATQNIPAHVIYNAVELARFSRGDDLRQQLDIDQDEVVVSFVGQIREIKGIADFVSMAKKVTGEKTRFLIAGQCRDKAAMGDAYSEDELHELISGDPRIKYCGYVDQVESIYKTSDVIVVPSRWEEPFGLVCIEAGAAGLPVVATRAGGLPEVIVDGVTGLLVDIGDIQAMSEQVQTLLDNAPLRARLGKAARIRVEEEFTDKPVRALENLYESLLASPTEKMSQLVT